MTPERWKRLEALFDAALDRPAGERGAFLAEACAGDETLRREVETLLASDWATESAMAALPAQIAAGWLAEPREGKATAGGEVGMPLTGCEQPSDAPQAEGPGDGAAPVLGSARAQVRAGAVAERGLEAGTILEGRYRIEALVGRGGMGDVYRATHLPLDRAVAVKLIRSEYLADRAMAERFRREAHTIARLKHPHIVTIHDFGSAPDVGMYLVMELLAGRSLREELERLARLPVSFAVELMRQVCSAVQTAHEAGVTHRDLKPGNIFLEETPEGFLVKVLDFGIVKLVEGADTSGEGLTRTGVPMGTPAYMAPEQCRGEAVDARTDVYALGCVLYELLTGHPPFSARTVVGLLVRHVTDEPVPPSRLAPGVPGGLDAVVLRALAKQPEQRFPSAVELRQALGAASGSRWARSSGAHDSSEMEAAPTLAGAAAATVVGGGASEVTVPNNLPQPLTRFVGRGPHIAEVTERLSVVRLVTLTGPGGIGKTRLALEIGAQMLDECADGVWLVELAALTDPALVPGAVAGALGVREGAGRTLAETLADSLRDKRLLLVLDNCEHLAAASAALAEALLRACPGVRVLATSRQPLGIAGEAVWPVPALSVPEVGRALSAEQLSGYEATRLFVERAALSRRGFAASARNAAAIAQVCRRLDGIPLAIELAAARTRALTVDEILARLDDRLHLLTGGSRTAPRRQQTLRATLDWSYALLDEAEQVLLRCLAVFAGGWTLEAAEAVASASAEWSEDPPARLSERGTPHVDVLDVLAHLVDRSLLLVAEHDRESRYRMLETVREYARERLHESGEADAIKRRHAEYCLELAEAAEPELGGSEAAAWIERLEAEHDNLRAALAWALEHDAEAALRLAAAVRHFWRIHGHYSEGRRWLASALERSRTAPARVRAKALYAAGLLVRLQGGLAAARAYYEQGVQVAREAGDTMQIGWSSQGLGQVAVMQGELRAARAYFEQSLANGREAGDDSLIANSLNDLGDVARLEGDRANARPFYEEALAIFRRTNAHGNLSLALGNLGALACEGGDVAVARACYEEALAIDRAMGNAAGISYSLDGLAAVAVKQGASAKAGRFAGAAEALREAVGHELEPADRAFRESYLTEARAALGEAALEAAVAEGQALTVDEVARLALEDDSGP